MVAFEGGGVLNGPGTNGSNFDPASIASDGSYRATLARASTASNDTTVGLRAGAALYVEGTAGPIPGATLLRQASPAVAKAPGSTFASSSTLRDAIDTGGGVPIASTKVASGSTLDVTSDGQQALTEVELAGGVSALVPIERTVGQSPPVLRRPELDRRPVEQLRGGAGGSAAVKRSLGRGRSEPLQRALEIALGGQPSATDGSSVSASTRSACSARTASS